MAVEYLCTTCGKEGDQEEDFQQCNACGNINCTDCVRYDEDGYEVCLDCLKGQDD